MNNKLWNVLGWMIFSLAAATVLQGCGGGGNGSDADDDADAPDGTEPACDRDPALLAERHECLRDDHCPCGAHCVLGLCAHDCEQDGDCGEGFRCDIFGRCRGEEDLGPFMPVDDGPQPVLEMSSKLLEFRSPGTERTVRVSSSERAAGTVRIVAGEGMEVQCDPAEGFTGECSWDGIDTGPEGARTLAVRYSGVPAAGEDVYGQVRLFTGNRRHVLGARIVAPVLHVLSLDDGAGIYRGEARPVGAWLSSSPRTDPLPDEVSDVRLPVALKVYPGSDGEHVVALSDEMSALFPAAPTVGRLTESGGTWHLVIEKHLFIGPDPVEDDAPEVTVRYASDNLQWTRGAIEADVDTVFEGAATDDQAPIVRWRLALSWAGDLEAGDTAPEVPAPYAGRDLAAATATALRVESGAMADLPADIGPAPADWAGAALCTCCDTLAEVRRPAEDILVLPSATVSPAGDLACVDAGEPQLTFPFQALDSFSTNEIVQACLDDLAIMDSGEAGLGGSTGCIDAPRVVAAMSLALAWDRDRAFGAGSSDETGSAMGHRMVQQWVGLHTFMAREADAVQALNDILPAGDRLEQSYTVLEALERGAAGWDLLLHPRIGAALPLITREVLNQPDYRPRLYPSGSYPDAQSNEQPVGLPASMLLALAGQLTSLAGMVEKAGTGDVDFSEVEALATALLRRGIVVLGLSRGLYFKAREVSEPAWQPEWDLALLSLASAVNVLLRAIEGYEEGRNPLGIEDSDLPIYRIGDDVTANDRFSALSDYLLGTGPADGAVAPALVQRAEESLADTESLWFALNDRNYKAALAQDEGERRIGGINQKYGSQITSLCGNPDWSSSTVLAMYDQIDPGTCYMAPECLPTVDDQRARVNAGDLGFALCLTGILRERYPAITSGSAAFDDEADTLSGRLFAEDEPFPIAITAAGLDDLMYEVTDVAPREGRSISWSDIEAMQAIEGDNLDPDFVDEVRAVCESARQATLNLRPVEAPDSCNLADDCPIDHMCSEEACRADTGTSAVDNPECYRGSLGAKAIAVMAAEKEIEAANASAEDLVEQYNLASENCRYMLERQEDIEEAMEDHNNQMAKYAKVKLSFQVASNFATATRLSCSLTDSAFSIPGAVTSAYAAAAADSIVNGMDYAMEEAKRELDLTLTKFEHEIAYHACQTEAAMIHTRIDTARLQAEAAALDMAGTVVEFRNLKAALTGLCREGHVALVSESERRVDPISLDFWFAEAMETYRDHMRQARRAAYLAMLSVEYEFQFTSLERDAILGARSPGELSKSLDNLRAVALTGTVGGALPANLFAVVSLKQHLSRIADHSAMPGGWATLSADERFHVWLTSDSHALYDEAGNYLGQEIPFAVWPRSDGDGIPILAGTDCAERLWSVNASLLGAGIYAGSGTFSRVVLRKRNTFHSQWCAGTHASDFQAASTRPSINLFLDPFSFLDSNTPYTPQPDTTSVDEVRAFSNARISAYFNVTRAELEDESYFNGDSQELAGRGLYGDYALFFPAETLSDGASTGLLIQNIDDVLLRLDYVSVATSGP